MNDLPTHSKTLHPGDFALLEPEVGFMRNLRHDLREVTVDLAHECRYWEYALALRVALRANASIVLDAGGGAGLFSAGAAKCGCLVTHLEPGDYAGVIGAHARVIGRPVRCVQGTLDDHRGGPYDLVACLSVIEHVPDDLAFFKKALGLVAPGGCLVLTTDFHPSGRKQVEGHLRTYNADTLFGVAVEHGALGPAKYADFDFWGGYPDWSYFGEHVYQYSFASLVLRRNV